jgi:hypothetical protein
MLLKMPRKRVLLLIPLALLTLVYTGAAVMLALRDDRIAALEKPVSYKTIVIFGASGTAGDGILKSALASPDIQKIHVITRRTTPRIDEGVAYGKVQLTLHRDYLDYSAIEAQIAAADAVYWAIGISSLGVDEKTYGTIHVDYPAGFVAKWLTASDQPAISFHYISSSDISEDSGAMWAREKVRAERTLFELAAGTKLRVIAYRPDYIGPTDEEAHLGQSLLYWFFAPIGAAVKAEQIGKAMIEVTARSDAFANGDKLGTRTIIRYADAYDRRASRAGQRTSQRRRFRNDPLELLPTHSATRPAVCDVSSATSSCGSFAWFTYAWTRPPPNCTRRCTQSSGLGREPMDFSYTPGERCRSTGQPKSGMDMYWMPFAACSGLSDWKTNGRTYTLS